MPPNAAAVTIDKVRVRTPQPHVLSQPPKLVYSVCTQSTGHGKVLHVAVSCLCAQGWPLRIGCTITRRERLRTPLLPHEREHRVKALNALILQCTGHRAVPHRRESTRGGQARPPYSSFRMMLRVRLCVAPPHVTGQGSQAENAVTWQWTLGHGSVAQSTVSINCGHTEYEL